MHWKDILGYEGHYQISEDGQVRSLDRAVYNGLGWPSKIIKGRIIKPNREGRYNLSTTSKPKKTFTLEELEERAVK